MIEIAAVNPEILFRGKRLDNGEWVYGVPVFDWADCSLKCKNQHKGELITFFGWDDSYHEYDYFNEVDPATVGQYTGLTDKNGVKIFVGDIVAWSDRRFILNGHYTYGFDGYKYGDELIVRRLESGFMLCKKHDGLPDIPNASSKIDNYAFWNHHRLLEVRGNIHDNPELLEV